MSFIEKPALSFNFARVLKKSNRNQIEQKKKEIIVIDRYPREFLVIRAESSLRMCCI